MSEGKVPFAHPWDEVRFNEVGTVVVGGTPHTGIARYWGGDVPWMASGDIHLRIITDVPQRITILGLRHSNAVLIDPPTVAIALAGQGKTRGTVALVQCTVSTNQSVALLKCNRNDVDPQYLFQNLGFRYLELRARSDGGGRAGLTKAILEQVPLPLPNLQEQRKIAEILSTVDRAITQTEALIAKQQRIKTGLMQDLLTRGIDEHGQLRSEATHQFKDSPLGRIPVEWSHKTVGEVLLRIDAGKSPDCPDRPAGAGEWGVLKVSAVQPDEFLPHENKVIINSALINPAYEIHDGDLLITRSNTFQLVGIVSLVVAPPKNLMLCDKTLRLQFNPAKAHTRFMFWLLQDPMIRRQIELNATGTSGSMKNISQPAIRSLKASLPGIKEQLRIVRRIDEIQANLTSNTQYRNKLQSLKTALMQDLLTGKVRVTALLHP